MQYILSLRFPRFRGILFFSYTNVYTPLPSTRSYISLLSVLIERRRFRLAVHDSAPVAVAAAAAAAQTHYHHSPFPYFRCVLPSQLAATVPVCGACRFPADVFRGASSVLRQSIYISRPVPAYPPFPSVDYHSLYARAALLLVTSIFALEKSILLSIRG